jgi:hypothetical protein
MIETEAPSTRYEEEFNKQLRKNTAKKHQEAQELSAKPP